MVFISSGSVVYVVYVVVPEHLFIQRITIITHHMSVGEMSSCLAGVSCPHNAYSGLYQPIYISLVLSCKQ